MLQINHHIFIAESEIKFKFVRASGPGGQNVNKVSTAVQLRFDVLHSPSLPDDLRMRLLLLAGKNVSAQGELTIKASRYRTQENNKRDALERFKKILKQAAVPPKKRKKTKPTKASKEKRIEKKKLRGKIKSSRAKSNIF